MAGGAGFVGSFLCQQLLKEGSFVICLDNLSTGKKRNIDQLLSYKRFKFIAADVVNLSLHSALEKKIGRLDQIYHLASPASPKHYKKIPLATFKANIFGTLNLLQLADKYDAKFLFASTSEIYGDPLEHPQKESYFGNVNPVGPRACYDESKRAGETLSMDYRRVFGLEIKIVRIFNTYGPRMAEDDGRVVSNFIGQALRNKPLSIYGKGSQTRSFMFVDDLVSALIKTMATAESFTGPVNLGNPQEFTISQLAKKVIFLTKSKSKLAHEPLTQDDPRQRRPDIALAKNKLNWKPKVALTAGLIKTIRYFKEEIYG